MLTFGSCYALALSLATPYLEQVARKPQWALRCPSWSVNDVAGHRHCHAAYVVLQLMMHVAKKEPRKHDVKCKTCTALLIGNLAHRLGTERPEPYRWRYS
jgi:hypothetical protein